MPPKKEPNETTVVVQRYTPIGTLEADAPGWSVVALREVETDDNAPQDETTLLGPICWKCHGQGSVPYHDNRRQRKRKQREKANRTAVQEGQPPKSKDEWTAFESAAEPSTLVFASSETTTKDAKERLDKDTNNTSSSNENSTVVVQTQQQPCKVCCARGRLLARKVPMDAPGRITRSCPHPKDYVRKGPMPAALALGNVWSKLVERAEAGEHVDITPSVLLGAADTNDPPQWLPQPGEELCRLTGAWRILQRLKSHRWTTDDLVTAWCALQEQLRIQQQSTSTTTLAPRTIRYLDLGTGNGSVLQMVLWACRAHGMVVEHATALEARREAVALARRSLSFNVGLNFDDTVDLIHTDFRSFNTDATATTTFDLITGTPPYFKVDFHVQPETGHVAKAVIRQGGMPTATASAPARCEFRGGIEAYLETGRRCLHPDGRLVVCENWANHHRTLEAIRATHGLNLYKVVQVQGKQGRGTLFAVYVMGLLLDAASDKESSSLSQKDEPEQLQLTVRDENGNWTLQYVETVMKDMNMPGPVNT